MAEFIVEFARGSLPPPTYDDYEKTERILCGDDAHERTVAFDSTGDFIVGLNFQSNYPPASTVIIESFHDVTIETQLDNGTIVNPAPGSSPSYLYRISTGTPLTYPYTIPVDEVSDIGVQATTAEIVCRTVGGKFSYQRTRRLGYRIMDSNGLYGDLKSSTLIINGII